MQLRPPFSSALLGLTALCGLVSGGKPESKLSLYGAPRHKLDPVLPILDIEEKYIRSQIDGDVTALGGAALQCSASNPCPGGSCCNDEGHCGYRDEHCKESCVANCDAKAPCGTNSKDGSQSCPLNFCCSHFGFCGASEFFCRDSTASGESTPCQKGFGKCGTVSTKSTPSCGKGSGTASRRVAYYEGWNTRRRPCDKVWPSQINTTGLTQIVFSFATIDPATFAVGPMHPDDEKLYTDFLGLKDGSQKWIGIGGWEFSDAGPTHQTWSLMASSKANRQVFISSLLDFLKKWDFAGVDIDWEWPGSDTRGGNPAIDKQNQVDLMKELRAALGSRGLSIVLPAQYAYLQHLDPKALEGYVDAFNVLAHDLHGPWDASIPDLGPYAKPHTGLNEIDAALELLWSADVTPSMFNLGIANYGRGFALADPDCAHINCTWTGPSKAGLCTQLDGVLSQCEIERAINQHNLKPELVEGAGIKQIVFDGQWFGYDDQQTLALKTELANDRCLGGTALWAIDYASCTGGGPVGPGGSPPSSAAPSSSAPGVSSIFQVSSTVAVSSEPVASSTIFTVSSVPAEPSKPAASSTAPSASAKPPAPAPSSSPEPTNSMISSETKAPSTPAPSAPASSAPAISSEAPAQSSQAMSSAPGSTSLTTSKVETSATSSAPSTASTPNETSKEVTSGSSAQTSTISTVSSTPTLSSSSIASSISSQASSARSSAESPSSSSPQSSAATTSSGSSAWSWSATSTATGSSETMSTSSQTSDSSRTVTSSGAQASTSDMSSSTSLWSPTQSASASSQSGSSVATTSGTTSAQSLSATSSDATHSGPWSLSSPDSTSMWFSTTPMETGASSDSSVWTWPTGISGKPSSETQSGTSSGSLRTSPLTAVPILSTLPASSSRVTRPSSSTSLFSFPVFTRTSDGSVTTVTESAVGTTIISAMPIVTPTPGSDSGGLFILLCPWCAEHEWCKDLYGATSVRDLPANPPKECLEDEDCLACWPKPAEYHPDLCPELCWFSDWCRPFCFDHFQLVPPEEGLPFPWFLDWWWNLPVLGCVPNDCVDECHSWFGLTIPLLGNPFCPCVPVTCTKGEEKKKKKDSKKCKFLGCGCGFMGLDIICDGTHIDIKVKFPEIFPFGLFDNPDPCYWFGCLPPPGPPPGPVWPGGHECGILGCHGYCYVEGGCDPCPPELCPPKYPSPKKGPDPTPVKSREPPKECEERDKTTVTERMVTCHGNFSLNPTTIASVNFTQTETLTSACVKVDLKLTGCGLLGTSSTTTLGSTTTGRTKTPSNLLSLITADPITPAPTATPGEPEKCEEKDKTTITNKIVSCFGSLKLVSTTIVSLNSTRTETLTTSCSTREETSTLCQGIGITTTTTATSYTRTSSESPSCSRFPLNLANDEGDNPQPPRDGPICQRAPLSLDDDEGDNEHPERPSCGISPLLLDDDEGDNSHPPDSGGPQCSRAPLSLDDDEGNNEMPEDTGSWNSIMSMSPTPSRVVPPSTLSESTTAPWGTGIPTGTPCQACDKHFNECIKMRCPDGSDTAQCAKFCLAAVCFDSTSPDICKTGTCRPPACPKSAPVNYETADPADRFTTVMSLPSKTTTVIVTPTGSILPNCPTCDNVFAECVKTSCLQDGSEAEGCAKRCMAYLCYGDHNAPLCKTGFCRPAACPAQTPVDYNIAQPSQPFTTALSFPSTTITVTPTPTYGEPTLKHGPTPMCTHGQEISPHAKWMVLVEHKIHQRPDNATLTWNLWDEHGCHAGNGMSSNVIVGRNITADIGAMGRPQKDMMGFMLQANITKSMTSSSSEIYFQISKPVADCQRMCHTSWKVNNRDRSNSWQIANDCAQACGMRALGPEDVTCDDGMNKWQDNGDNPTDIRGGYCTFRMPFEPMDDSAPPPPAPWTRNSRWTIDFIQQMEYETASIEWWLRNPDGKNVSHFVRDLGTSELNNVMIETDVDIAADKRMRYKMLLQVADPMDKDKTTISITYNSPLNKHCHYCKEKFLIGNMNRRCGRRDVAECQPSYQTETNDEKQQSFLNICSDPHVNLGPPGPSVFANEPCKTPMVARNDSFSCDPVAAAFYPKNAGFERRFKCWWPNDFDDPYGRDVAPPAHVNWQLDIDPNTYQGADMAELNETAGTLGIDGGANGS